MTTEISLPGSVCFAVATCIVVQENKLLREQIRIQLTTAKIRLRALRSKYECN